MKDQNDLDRRKAAIEEVKELGHQPIVFEDWPSRSLPKETTLITYCEEKVASSDILIIIIDDDISDAMEAEHDAALNSLGEDKIFYYFTTNKKKTLKAMKIREKAKHGYIIKEFESLIELRKEIKRSIASYIDDVIEIKRKKSEILVDEEIKIGSGKEKEYEFELNKGDVVTITCMGNGKFYAGFFNREDYIQRRSAGIGGAFGFNFGDDCPEYTTKVDIPEDDDYYLVLRVSVLSGTTRIRVKVRVT